jgi:hypothetical protein
MGECPGNAGEVKTAGYLGIFINVTRIIIINEIVPERLAENHPRKDGDTDADADSQPPAVHFRRASWLNTKRMHAPSLLRCRSPGEITKPQF